MYDISSITHYTGEDGYFDINPRIKKSNEQRRLGTGQEKQRVSERVLSTPDINRINIVYQCVGGFLPKFLVCPHSPFSEKLKNETYDLKQQLIAYESYENAEDYPLELDGGSTGCADESKPIHLRGTCTLAGCSRNNEIGGLWSSQSETLLPSTVLHRPLLPTSGFHRPLLLSKCVHRPLL